MNRSRRQSPSLSTESSRHLALALAVSGVLMAGPSWSLTLTREFDVGSGALKPALDAYIAQSGVQLIYKVEDVMELSTRGVRGKIAPDAALERLLEGTRLRIRRGQDGAMVLIAPADKKP